MTKNKKTISNIDNESPVGLFYYFNTDWRGAETFDFILLEFHECRVEWHVAFALFGFGITVGYQYAIFEEEDGDFV